MFFLKFFSGGLSLRFIILGLLGLMSVGSVGALPYAPTLVTYDPQYLVAAERDGLTVERWQGLLAWQALPTASPLMVRAYDSTGRLLMPARFLVEPYFDLMEIPGVEDHHEIRLELVLIEGREAPSEADLFLPAENLIHTDRVQAVLRSRVRRVERSTPPTGSESSVQVGFRLFGELPEITNLPRCSDDENLQALDLKSVWHCFWQTLGPGLLPEIPLYDFDQLAAITRRLRFLGPRDWRAPMAEAQVWTLRENHKKALEKLDEVARRCDDQECRDLETALRNFVEVDRHSSFASSIRVNSSGRGSDNLVASLGELEGEVLDAFFRSNGTPTGRLIAGWLAGAKLRWRLAQTESDRFSMPADELELSITAHRKNISNFGRDGWVSRLLQFRLYPQRVPVSVEELPEEATSAKAMMRVESLLAPTGGLVSLDVPVAGIPSSYHRFLSYGLTPPEIAPASAEQIQAARRMASLHRSSASLPIQSGRRLLAEGFGRYLQGDLPGLRSNLRKAEITFQGQETQRDLAQIELLRVADDLSDSSPEAARRASKRLQAIVSRSETSGSVGRAMATLKLWEHLALREFFHDRQYRNGLLLIEGAEKLVSGSHPVAVSTGILRSSLRMLSSLDVPRKYIQKSSQILGRLSELTVQRYSTRDTPLRLDPKFEESSKLLGELETDLNLLCLRIEGIRFERASALAGLGEDWQSVEAELDALTMPFTFFKKRGIISPDHRCSSLLEPLKAPFIAVLESNFALSNYDFSGALGIAQGITDPSLQNLQNLFLTGNPQALKDVETLLAGFETWADSNFDDPPVELLELAATDKAQNAFESEGAGEANDLREPPLHRELCQLQAELVELGFEIDEASAPCAEARVQLGKKVPPTDFVGSQADSTATDLREQYFQLCSGQQRLIQGAHECRADEEYEKWLRDSFNRQLVELVPWKNPLIAGQVAEAEGRFVEAFDFYQQAIHRIAEDERSRNQTNRSWIFKSSRREAYMGAARATSALRPEDSEQSFLLSLTDELTWIEGSARLGLPGWDPPAFPDLEILAKQLRGTASILFIADTNNLNKNVWIYSEENGLRFRQFRRDIKVEPTHPWESLKAHTHSSEPTSVLHPDHLWSQVTGWIAEQIPPATPVVVVMSSTMRSLLGHQLKVDGEPLVIRNPTVIAPSFRRLAQMATEPRATGKPWVIGVPESTQAPRSSLRSFADRPRLERIADQLEGELLWQGATVGAVESKAASAPWLHFSTHGVVSPLYPERTGLLLQDGRLNLTRTRALKLPGSVVVLSVCNTGNWGDPSSETTSTLDLIFLDAGASLVVSAAQAVDVKVASTWMDAFYDALSQGLKPAWAGREAYRVTRDLFPGDSWGAFTLVGAGGF